MTTVAKDLNCVSYAERRWSKETKCWSTEMSCCDTSELMASCSGRKAVTLARIFAMLASAGSVDDMRGCSPASQKRVRIQWY